jgi:Uri superfamily endonuclease
MATADNLLGNKLSLCSPSRTKGSYVLLMMLSGSRIITVGSLSDIRFSSGFYAYVGSAMGGIAARLGYHLKRNKKRHWHIDYLLEEATIVDISICANNVRSECDIARSLGSQFDSVPGFGSSDCRCPSHLFFHTDEGRMRDGIREAISLLSVPT